VMLEVKKQELLAIQSLNDQTMQQPQLGLATISSDLCPEANRELCVLVRMGCSHRQFYKNSIIVCK